MKKLAYILALTVVSTGVYAESAPAAAVKDAAATDKVSKAVAATADKAVAATEKPAAAKKGEAKSDVRIPTGDVEKFWGEFGWDDLSAGEKNLWGILGWNAKLWEAGAASKTAPASQNTGWDQLGKKHQDAAKALGYDKKSWDQE